MVLVGPDRDLRGAPAGTLTGPDWLSQLEQPWPGVACVPVQEPRRRDGQRVRSLTMVLVLGEAKLW